MNFGETLAYWYLRLNGFFPLKDFVLHRPHNPDEAENYLIERTSDADLLAVRFPNVFENIGGQPDDWDHQNFVEMGFPLDEKIICLIVQVKVTKTDTNAYRQSIADSFRRARLHSSLHRIGVFPSDRVGQFTEELYANSFINPDGFQNIKVGKLLIARTLPEQQNVPHLQLELNKIDEFINNRLNGYAEKHTDKLFFFDDLIQYLAWKNE